MAEIDMRPNAVVPLKFPVTVDAETYKELNMRRPKMKDTLALSQFGSDDSKRAVRLMALLAGVADDVIEELDELDIAAVQAQYAAFTGRPSGRTN